MVVVGVEERRNRLARRHLLIDRASGVDDVAAAMVALHATDPASVYLSAAARMVDPSIEEVDRALYHDRSVVRILAMRRTLFVTSRPHLAEVELAGSTPVAADQRRKLEALLAEAGINRPDRWLAEVGDEVEAAIDPGGTPARVITSRVPRLAHRLVLAPGSRNEATVNATSRVLLLMALEGRLIRGRPGGGWTGRQYAWSRRADWLAGGPIVDPEGEPADRPDQMVDEDVLDEGEASRRLVRRWLRTFGPAPLADLRWWSGWTLRRLRPALAGDDVVEVDLAGGGTGLALANDLDREEPPGPWAALLPSLDPTPMGWKERSWYLGEHAGPLFDRSGNIGPTVWVDGGIVGGWGQRPDGTVAVRLLEDVGADHRALIDREVERLDGLLGSTVVRPSFPTPLQKELASGPPHQYSS